LYETVELNRVDEYDVLGGPDIEAGAEAEFKPIGVGVTEEEGKL
jgi:hypothetical protein